jgi:methylmalonyl-CoA/ethylmalonyl-CoA epimerase
MIVDHICFAVRDIKKAIEDWTGAFGYRQMTEIVINSRQKVYVVFLEKNNSVTIKLIEPLPDNESVLRFVRKGGGFHHLCFKTEDGMDHSLSELKEKGLVVLVPPQPGEAFENENIAFLLTRFGINVELIDTDRKANKIND